LYSAKISNAGSSCPVWIAVPRLALYGANFATSAAVKNILLPSSASK
jgi:hypothetical protein